MGWPATAKLILADGHLREFDHPVEVSSVLEKNPNWFVCDADEMELLRPQLFFVTKDFVNRTFFPGGLGHSLERYVWT